MVSRTKADGRNTERDGVSPGKIFIGGLAKDTSLATFSKHFGKYEEMTDYVIMKDKVTNQPRGFGFVTYADPSVVDRVLEDNHVINGKQVEIKRTIPKDASSKDFKTKKNFIGGLPSTYTEDELKNFFSKYGKVVEHQIVRDHHSDRSRGFGFVVFDSDQVVDDLLANGNMIDLAGTKVEIKKAEPKKPSKQAPAFGSDYRGHSFGDSLGGYGSSYSGFSGGFGPSYRTPAGLGTRLGGYGGYGSGSGEFDGGYGGYGGGSLSGYRGESSIGYSSRLGSYGGGFSGRYGGSLGGYGHDEAFGGYGGSSGYGGSYESGPGAGYGSGPIGGPFGGRGGYGGPSRYHPYGR